MTQILGGAVSLLTRRQCQACPSASPDRAHTPSEVAGRGIHVTEGTSKGPLESMTYSKSSH